MDSIRKNYHSAKKKYMSNVVEKAASSTRMKDKLAYDQAELLRYKTFKEGIVMGRRMNRLDLRFDLERFVNLTDQDKKNLLMLRTFKNINWYVETHT